MKPSPSLVFALFLCLLPVAVAWAEQADRNKPMNIEADALYHDEVKQTSVFSGNVVLTKGSIVLRGQQIEVRQDPDGYQYGTITGSAHKPALFRQKREGLDEYIEGQGATVEYDSRSDTVTLRSGALLRRLRGAVVADEISGGLIVYENQTDTFRVDGKEAQTAASGGRVRAMLTPKPEGQPPRRAIPGTLRPATVLNSPPP